MKRLLVTGATGMLGSYVVQAASDAGWAVRALVRDPGRARWLEEEQGAELAPGDLLSAGSLRRASAGCDAVVHAAAVIGSGDDLGRFRAGNVVGTDHVVEAAARSGARLVHVSSTAVVGQARYRSPAVDESVALPRLPRWDVYGRTKQEAERVVLAAVREGRIRATVVRPPMMYGRRDRQFVPRLAPVLRRGVAPLPRGGDTRLPLVHGSSVASGILRALESDAAVGRVYHLTEDRPVTFRALCEAGARGLGRPVRLVRVPGLLSGVGFAALGTVLTLVGRLDLARRTRSTCRLLTRDNPFPPVRARVELGWRPTLDPERAIEDAFRWWARRSDGSEATREAS